MITSPPKIDGYKFIREIGSGGFSTVFLVQQGNQLYAAKVIPLIGKKKIANSQSNREFIEREIKVMQKSNHPYIAHIINLLKDKQNIYIIEEFIQNSLFDIIEEKKKSFMEFTARPIIFQILQAISYLHSIGFCHRDVKPQNILITDDGTIKLIDFGLATPTSVTNVRCGSKLFFPPEVMLPTKSYDHKNTQEDSKNIKCSNSFNSFERYEQNQNNINIDGIKCDAWSCGVTFFLILTGKMPWSNMTIEQITSEKINYPPYLSNECIDFLDKLLTVDPEQRITVEDALNHKWLLKNASLSKHVISNRPCNRLSSEKIDKFLSELQLNAMPTINYRKNYGFRNNENESKNQNTDKMQFNKSHINDSAFEMQLNKKLPDKSLSSSFIDDDLNLLLDPPLSIVPKNNNSNSTEISHPIKSNEKKPIEMSSSVKKLPIFSPSFHEEKEKALNTQVENIFQKINALKKSMK